MAATPKESFLHRRGNQWLTAGGIFGAVGAFVAIGLPVLFLGLAKDNPGGFFTFAPSLLQLTSLLILAGGVLVLVSFFCYRWAYSVLRQANSRFWFPSALCLIGSSGLILLVIAAALASGESNALSSCAQGSISNAWSCVESASPVGAYAGALGFWLGWIGAIGVVIGLFMSSGAYRSALYGIAAVVYAILVVVLVGPFAALAYPVPYLRLLLILAPILAIVGPILVAAARPTIPPPMAAPGGAPPTHPT